MTKRWSETQSAVADWYQAHGWPYATSTGSGRQGVDIIHMDPLFPEVKARRNFDPLAWIRQARRNAGNGLAYVVFRPHGLGLESIGDWPVIRRLEEDTYILRKAGFGDE